MAKVVGWFTAAAAAARIASQVHVFYLKTTTRFELLDRSREPVLLSVRMPETTAIYRVAESDGGC